MSQTLSQRRALRKFNSEFYGDLIAGVCVILIPFLLWMIGAAFV